MITTAVILAAGRGTRLQNVLKDVPKGFLEINGLSLIERSLKLLSDAGIRRTVIVTGHLSEFYEDLQKRIPGVETIRNEIYADSGSMYSYYCARPLIHDDVLLLESDLIYEPRALESLISTNQKDAILISGKTLSGDEVYVETIDERISHLSKNPDDLKSITGELVGISKISYDLYLRMIQTAETLFQESLKVEYEHCLIKTAQSYPVYYLKIEDLIWSEIDDESHLKRVRETILPKLLRK
jgi:2-aminoethylphosphonate-pyruvate transaminase